MALPARILVVDDDPVIRELCIDVLTDEGYTVLTASDGPAALATLAVVRVDLVVIDHHMPGMDGLTVCRILRAQTHTRTLPILLLSAARALAGPAAGPMAQVVTAVRTKPFELDDLLTTVAALVQPERC